MFLLLLLLYKDLNPAIAGLTRIDVKEREKKENLVRRGKKRKGIEAQIMKHPTLSRSTDALIGDEDQNGNQKRTKRKKQGAGPQPSYPGPFSRLLRRAEIIR